MADIFQYLGVANIAALKALTADGEPRLVHKRLYPVFDTSDASDGTGLPGWYLYKAEPLPGGGALPAESLPEVVDHPTGGVFVLMGGTSSGGGGGTITTTSGIAPEFEGVNIGDRHIRIDGEGSSLYVEYYIFVGMTATDGDSYGWVKNDNWYS